MCNPFVMAILLSNRNKNTILFYSFIFGWKFDNKNYDKITDNLTSPSLKLGNSL